MATSRRIFINITIIIVIYSSREPSTNMAQSKSHRRPEGISENVVIDRRQSALRSQGPAELYRSLPLPRNDHCIRVLDLCGPSKLPFRSNRQALTGTLRVVSLADCPQYTALSYRWGGYSSPKDIIMCNGGFNLEVTTSCRDALLALTKQFGALTVWVDAICIDQSDATEKSDQVPLMDEIYTWAERVFVWLGPGDECSRGAMEWLRHASYGSVVELLVCSASAPSLGERFGCKLALIGSMMWYAIYKYIDAGLFLIRKCLAKPTDPLGGRLKI